ncbi:MAG: thioredoxin domain-containing protein [Gemmatimonadaceae bacterium]
MAQKRVESGKGRKPGVVKATKKASSTNRAFYLIIGAIAVVGIGALTYASTRSKDNVDASPIDSTLPPVQSAGYVIGSPTAPIEVTEFGDYECPACGRFATLTEPDIRKAFVETGKIRWRFVDFPLSMHKNTWQAARAAACADEQGKFWPFHDLLYQNQDLWNGEATSNPDKFMKEYGKQVGADPAKFDACVDSKKYQAKIQAHYNLAMQRQVQQTPTFVIGDQQVANALSFDEISKLINDALAKAPPVKSAPTVGGDTALHPVSKPAKKGE